jgi:ribokinase
VRYDLVAVGEVLVDVTLGAITPGEVRHAPIRLRAGGTAVNAALAAGGAGARAAVVGRVGADAAADAVRAHLRAAGVEALLATDPCGRTGVFVETTVAGARTLAVDRGASDALSEDDLPAAAAAATLVSGHLLFHDSTRGAAAAALGAFDSRIVSVTAPSTPTLERLGLRAVRGRAEGADLFVGNAAEARQLTGRAPEDAAVELAAIFGIACVTLGPGGAVAASPGRLEHVAADSGSDADILGAGDALAGALTVALARGRDLADALAEGVAAGGLAARAAALR